VGLLRLFNSSDEKTLWQSYLSLVPVNTLELSSDNRLPIDFTLMKRGFTNAEIPWERVLASSYSLAIGLYRNDTRAELSFNDIWTPLDEWTKQGTLLLDTAAINALLTGSTYEAATTLEIQVTDSATGNKYTSYRNTGVTLRKPLISSGSVSPAPGQVFATQEFVRQTSVPRDGTNLNNPCKEFFMLTEDGRPVVVRVGANNQVTAEPY
jgi:hypothetical protein